MISSLNYIINALNSLLNAIANWDLGNGITLFDLIFYLLLLTIAVYFISHIQFSGGSSGSVHNKRSTVRNGKGVKHE